MHSHIGADSLPTVNANHDENEMTNPTFPQVRVLDAVNPGDGAIPLVVGGGITTVQVLPGSGNLMGGMYLLSRVPLNP